MVKAYIQISEKNLWKVKKTKPVLLILVLVTGLVLSPVYAETCADSCEIVPNPADAATNISSNINLHWTAGQRAVSYDVYFGTSFEAVNDASRLTGDINGDNIVDWLDIMAFADQWNYPVLTADINNDGIVNFFDFTQMAENFGANTFLSGDINGDTTVDWLDVAIFANQWALTGNDLAADINGDNIVNFVDFTQMADNFGKSAKTLGDINGDARVDWLDVLVIAEQWLFNTHELTADINADDGVDFIDFAKIAENFGETGSEIYKGNYNSSDLIYNPGTLAFQKTYYWRVDEVGWKKIRKGNVWSFTTGAEVFSPGAELQTDTICYSISSTGSNILFADKIAGINLATVTKCAQLTKDGITYSTTSVTSSPATGKILMQFGASNVNVLIDVVQKNDYLIFEVNSVSDPNIDSLKFINMTLSNSGSTNDDFPACVMALNLKTNVAEMPGSNKNLAATCYKRFGLKGAKAAVVCSPKASFRDVMKQVINDADGTDEIPKSTCGGPWAMDDPNNYDSYLFSSGISAQTVSSWVDLCVNKIGIYQINFSYPNFRWGDYKPNTTYYPAGISSVKTVNDALHAAGIKAGLHTYSFCIAKDSVYVTPVPDPRLDSDVNVVLTADINSTQTTILITASAYEASQLQTTLSAGTKTIRIENELFTYGGISGTEPSYSLTNCVRGVCGTTAAPHTAGVKAYHLKEIFSLFVPRADSSLFTEIAQNIADTFNQGDFDMIYFDALDGQYIFAGTDVGWYYGSKFVFEVAKRLNKPAIMEMSTFHHHLWYLRSRAGAWDVSKRGHKYFIDRHILVNEKKISSLLPSPGALSNMFMPSHLGWYNAVTWNPPQDEVTYPDVIEYLCGKCLAWDASLSIQGYTPTNVTSFKGKLASVIKNYETLRRANYFSQSVKEQLKAPGSEFTLKQNEDNLNWELWPVQYAQHKVLAIDGQSNVWNTNNKFHAQPLKLRIEALKGTGPYDSAVNPVLASFETVDFTDMRRASGVASSLTIDTSVVHSSSSVSGKFTATNVSANKTAAWANAGKIFSPVKNLYSYQGMGVWIYGDNKGELVNIQLRNASFAQAIAEHYIDINFTGWKYFELVETESTRYWDYSWPYGWEFAIHFFTVGYSDIQSFKIFYNNIDIGETVTCYFSPVKALPLTNLTISNPQVTVGQDTIIFPCNLVSGYYLEFNSESDCKLYNHNGDFVSNITPIGTLPILQQGDNNITFDCGFSGGQNARAIVTIISHADKPVN